jgi:hypothetical protein
MYDEKIALLGGNKKLNNNKLTNLRPVKGNDDRNRLPVAPFESYTCNFIDVTSTRPHNKTHSFTHSFAGSFVI